MCPILRPSLSGNTMEFLLEEKHLKSYPHFDQRISLDELNSIVADPERVRKNAFLPLIQFVQRHQPFRDSGRKPKKKERVIRYASRKDSAIFAYYRMLLSEKYEQRLLELGISEIPTAYRKVPLGNGSSGGKCNIDFAADLFHAIQEFDECTVFALDISKYFDSIDHQRLYQCWCQIIGTTKLPEDHLAVFKAITRYHYVDKIQAYEQLGFFGPKIRKSGISVPGYLVHPHKMPMQLCKPEVFRTKITGLIKTNLDHFGIPQGAPISDLLANLYLLEFDYEVATRAKSQGGHYWRYSDDIVLVLPGILPDTAPVQEWVSERLSSYGDQLKIKAAKTAIGTFSRNDEGTHDYAQRTDAGDPDGIQYLGFRFDGKKVYLRNSTMSNFYRKITRRARKQAEFHFRRYEGKSKEWLMEHFNFHDFENQFGRVRDFESASGKSSWTFWTYARRASERFGKDGLSILRQVKNYRSYVRRAVSKELDRQISNH